MRPLEGITVVSVEQAVAAPMATRHLADLGARVIKLERIDGGDFARRYDEAANGMAVHFVWLNRSKESVCVDLKSSEALPVVKRLIRSADVFLQNLAPGAIERLGLGSRGLRDIDPSLITVDMSGYGAEGPYADKRAYDLLVQSEAGLVSMTGTPETQVKTGIPTADIAAGMYAFSAVLAALFRRMRTGDGASIQISMFDSVVEWMGHSLYTGMFTGSAPPRAGLSHPVIAPYDAYPTADGKEILIGVQNDRSWRRLVTEVCARPSLADDPRYATNVARCERRSEVDAIVAAATRCRSQEQLAADLDAAGIANAGLNTVLDVLEHPQLTTRGRWSSVETPVGKVAAVLPPITFEDVEARMDPVPELGEHTESVLREIGLSDVDVERLREGGSVR